MVPSTTCFLKNFVTAHTRQFGYNQKYIIANPTKIIRSGKKNCQIETIVHIDPGKQTQQELFCNHNKY